MRSGFGTNHLCGGINGGGSGLAKGVNGPLKCPHLRRWTFSSTPEMGGSWSLSDIALVRLLPIGGSLLPTILLISDASRLGVVAHGAMKWRSAEPTEHPQKRLRGLGPAGR